MVNFTFFGAHVPTVLKFVTMFRGGEGYGWSEVHYRLSDSDTPDLKSQLNSFIANVLPARQQLLGEDCAIVGARVSYPRAGAIASYGLRYFLPGPEGHTGSAAQISLAINFVDSTYTKKKILHLRGFWDSVEYNESYHPEAEGAAGWEAALIGFKTALISNSYGWPTKSIDNSARGVVATYTALGTGHVKLTLADVVGPLPPLNAIVTMSFSKINKSNSILNRALLVQVTGVNEVTTIQQVGAGPFESKGRFNYRAVGFTAYKETGSISVGERRMGKPLNRTPGRSRAKRLY
jgi:hypothetical protein